MFDDWRNEQHPGVGGMESLGPQPVELPWDAARPGLVKEENQGDHTKGFISSREPFATVAG